MGEEEIDGGGNSFFFGVGKRWLQGVTEQLMICNDDECSTGCERQTAALKNDTNCTGCDR